MASRQVEIVVNPASGARLGLSLVETHIKPILQASLSTCTVRVRQTESEGDGVRLGNGIIHDYLSCSSTNAPGGVLDIVLVGGDGTTHELLNGLFLAHPDSESALGKGTELPQIRLCIVPAGTANALFSAMYPTEWTQDVQQQAATAKSVNDLPQSTLEAMLRSVHSLVSSASSNSVDATRLHTLPLILNQLSSKVEKENKTLVSHLVTSHALHAAILHDADTPAMRAKHDGIERFKAAAQLNATRWTQGSLTLHPTVTEDGVLKYSPETKRFEDVSRLGQTKGKLVLEGPFLYLNAMVTDRLESAFVPAPLSSAFSSNGIPPDAVDVVVIRPRRDPELSQQTAEEEVMDGGVKFASTRLGPITTGMYTGGKHIDLTYTEGGEPIVEYLRCSGYVFTPLSQSGPMAGEDNNKGRLVCTDGLLSFADEVRVHRWNANEPVQASDEGKAVRTLAPPLVWR